jgi:hypothetical protein
MIGELIVLFKSQNELAADHDRITRDFYSSWNDISRDLKVLQNAHHGDEDSAAFVKSRNIDSNQIGQRMVAALRNYNDALEKHARLKKRSERALRQLGHH